MMVESSEHPVSDAFLDDVRRNIVLISARTAGHDDPMEPLGTGFILGILKNPKYPDRAIIATAGHVLARSRGEPTEWQVQRVTDSGVVRTARFVTPDADPGGSDCYWYTGPQGVGPSWNTTQQDVAIDIGGLNVCHLADDGRPFLDVGDSLTRVIKKGLVRPPGTRVAWAGFPAHVTRVLGSPHMCYFEGVISLTVPTSDRNPCLYLIDGHNVRGLSGSPVWCWDDVSKRAEVIGIVTHYSAPRSNSDEPAFPGMVHATPINALTGYLESRCPRDQTIR